MTTTPFRAGLAAMAAAAALGGCGGGEVSSFFQFVGSAGGTWLVDDGNVAGFQQRRNCGALASEGCFVNIKLIGS
jgi:hypothetical protein